MGLNTYAGLKVAIATWLARPGDPLITGSIPDMIELFEAEANRKLAHLGQDLTALASNNQSNWLLANHPDTYLFGSLVEAEAFVGHDERIALWKTRRDEVFANILRANLQRGTVTDHTSLSTAVYNWLGRPADGLMSGSIPDMIAMFEAMAFRKLKHTGQTFTPLISGSNWLMTNHPDSYLYGTLAAAEPFMPPGDPRAGMWKAMRDEILGDILRDALARTTVTDYATLVTSVYNWLGRTGAGVSSGSIPDMIAMFEAYAFRKLRQTGQIFTALSLGANWLMTHHPDAYLYGTLAAAEPFMAPDDPHVGMWKAKRDEIIADILRDALAVTDVTSYATLVTAVYGWLGRSGDGLTSGAIPNMISLFEAEARRRLKTRWQETTAVLAVAAGADSVSLPTDFGMLRSIRLSDSDPILNLYYLTPEQLTISWDNTFTIEGLTLRLPSAVGDETLIEIGYIGGLTALSSGNTSNWLLANHPDAYIYGALAAAEPFVVDPRVGMWKAKRDEIFDSIERADRVARWPGGSLQMRPDIVTRTSTATDSSSSAEASMTTVTLNANATTTILTNPNLRASSYVHLSPTTENAAQAMVMGIWISPANGSATIHHVLSDATDMTFTVQIV